MMEPLNLNSYQPPATYSNNETTIIDESATSGIWEPQLSQSPPSLPNIPERSLFERGVTYAQGVLTSLINRERSEFLYTEEFIHRLLTKEQPFDPNTLYIVRANLPEEDQAFSLSSAYQMLVDPSFCGTVDLSGVNVDQWPEKLRINGSLNLSDSSIDRLPNTLIVDQNLNISGCKNLTSLSEIKTVVDGVLLARRSGLKSIKSELKAGSIDLSESSDFGEFGSANQFIVSGNIVLDGCKCLCRNLPNWLFNLEPMPNGQPRRISLLDTGIYDETLGNSYRSPITPAERIPNMRRCVLILDSLRGSTTERIN